MVRCSRDRTIYSCDLVLTSLMSSSSNILHCCCEPYQCFRKLKAPWLLPPPAARTGCITYIPAKVNASCCIQLQCKGMLHYMYIYTPQKPTATQPNNASSQRQDEWAQYRAQPSTARVTTSTGGQQRMSSSGVSNSRLPTFTAVCTDVSESCWELGPQ